MLASVGVCVCVCVEERVMAQSVSAFARTRRHTLRDLKMNQLRLSVHYV